MPTTSLNDPKILDSMETELDLREYFKTLWEGRWLILGTTAVFTLAGVAYGVLSAPIYRSNLLVQVEAQTTGDPAARNLVGQLAPLLGDNATTAAEIEILRSRAVLGKAVNALVLNVQTTPEYFPVIGRWLATRGTQWGDTDVPLSPPLLGLTRYAWGGEEIVLGRFSAQVPEGQGRTWTVVAGANGAYTMLDADDRQVLSGRVGEEARASRVVVLINKLTARPGTRFKLTYSTELSTITTLQNTLSVAELGKQTGIIDAQLEGTNPRQIAGVLNAVGDAYVQQNIERRSAEAEKTLAFLDEQLPQLRMQLDGAEQRYNQYRSQHGTIDIGEEAKTILQQSVEASTRLVTLQQQRTELIQRFTPQHPSVMAVDGQIAGANALIASLSQRIARLPSTEQESLRLMRDVNVTNGLYTNLLNNAQQLRVLKAGQVGSVRVVDRALPGDFPVKPLKTLIAALALVLGLLVGVALALLRKNVFRGAETASAIERTTGLPVIASIPRSQEQQKIEDLGRRTKQPLLQLLSSKAPQDLTMESLRGLRTSLQFAMQDAPNNIVMFTGPTTNVGKSFISANLAAVMAAGGRRVLLVDGDLRHGHMHQIFGVASSPGLGGLLAGTATLAEAVRREVQPRLDLIPLGSKVENPGELLGSVHFADLLIQLSGQYDIVFIDTPPVLPVADAATIGRHAGTVLLTLRFGKHRTPEIREAVRRLQNSGVAITGILFNDVPRTGRNYNKYGY